MDEKDDHYVLRPEKWVEEPQQVKINRQGDTVVSMDMGNRLGVVADFQPRVLWGVEDNRPFTILDARMTVELGLNLGWPPQVYQANYVLWDAHIDGFASPAEAIRIAVPIRWAGWTNQESIVTEHGYLSAWSNGNLPGLVWEPTQSSSANELIQRFPSIVTTLFQLWTEVKTSACSIEIRIKNVGWCQLKSTSAPTATLTQPLLQLDKLTLAVVSKWLSMAQILGPVPFMAVQGGAPLQSDAQMLATALEGLHRRLNPDAKRFQQKVSKTLLDRARREASRAAVGVLSGVVNESAAKKAYDEALGHIEEPSYAARISGLLPPVERVAPGLLGPSQSEWIQDMKVLRNVQSHGLKTHDAFGDTEVSQYYVMAASGRWVLKILLLLELVEEEQLELALRGSERFMYSLANIDRENYWEDFSTYRRFLEGS
ncbi:HEPN domain-containing protein [Arthrobacter sp. HY1533]|uniref:HEPN domain-containing protein n=1 Tax=Arthrobacter sp. HY1533 TaxID=2970919 RepID=UPI0022B9F753|nr:HEPN domain-containing protein [Arthrobacter sp. HY1533]